MSYSYQNNGDKICWGRASCKGQNKFYIAMASAYNLLCCTEHLPLDCVGYASSRGRYRARLVLVDAF